MEMLSAAYPDEFKKAFDFDADAALIPAMIYFPYGKPRV